MSLHSETRGIRMSLTSRRMWWPEPCHHFVMCPPQNTVASFCLSGESPLCSPGWPGMCLSFPRMEITSHVPPCLLSATEGIESWTLCTLGSTLPTNLNVLAQREPLTDGEWQEAKLKSLHGRDTWHPFAASLKKLPMDVLQVYALHAAGNWDPFRGSYGLKTCYV